MGATLSAMMPRVVMESFRTIDVLQEGVTPGPAQQMMADNSVVTSKYNVLTFIPRSLFEQFRRVANIYFLVISVLMMIGTFTTLFVSPLTPWSTLIPLVFVLLITMVKDGAEDLKRHRSDKRVNSTEAQQLDIQRRGEFKTIEWRDVRVGMILKVEDRQEIPADMVLIASSESGGIGYIETANIDGETNLKIRTSAPTRGGQPPGPAWEQPQDLHGVRMKMEYEAPNPRIHFFTGTLSIRGDEPMPEQGDGGELGSGGGPLNGVREVPIDQSNLLLRGSRLRNTKWVLGIVAYTGKESKIAQNARAPPSKQSNLDKVTNKIMLVIFISMAAVTTLSLVGYLIFSAEYDSKLYYLCYDYEDAPVELFRDNCEDSDSSSDVGQWFTFLILFNNFIPISLYVTLEMVNYFHASFIDEDLRMYDEAQDTPAQARSANMSADLGQIEYIFSDKTGTLTQNVMKFKRCSTGGQIFGEVDAASKKLLTPAQLARVVDAPPLTTLRHIVSDSTQGAAALDFALCLALNHTVMLEVDPKTGAKQMQAESPDEEALVDGAKILGIEFADRSPGEVMVEVAGKGKLKYNLIVTIPFNSTRKRMSVIVQAPDGSYALYCKGADNIIMERSVEYAESKKSIVEEHLGVFSNDGLRTLLLAKRDLPQEFFEEWHGRYKTASIATDDRAEQIAEVAKEVEVNLTVVGATAIEDKLQDEVPQTIADLGKAGVKLWVLTGDKMETAINIGYSCRLLEPDMTLIKLQEKKGEPDSVVQQLRSLMMHFNRLVEDEGIVSQLWGRMRMRGQEGGSGSGRSAVSVEEEGTSGLPEPLLERPEGAPPLSDLSTDSLAFILDGPSLVHVLGNPEAERMLLTLGSMCKSVVACRVSPAQKRLIVRLVKRGVVPTPVTLSIGDGANDVGMIQEAQIGVGISGKEGRQAVNNADFAIAQFRFLKRLMLVHGHWDYRRMCKVILYSFYKNIVLSFTLFYFCFYSGFSGQSLYETYVYSGFNWFLAMPILCVGLFDQDVRSETALELHKLYAVGRRGMDLNIRVMTKSVVQALVDSVIVFFLPLQAYMKPMTVWAKRGYSDGLYVFGTVVYACLIMAMMMKVFNMTRTWTWVNHVFWWGSLVFFFGFISLYSLIIYFYDYYWVAYQLMSRATFWLLLIQVPALSWVVDVFIRMIEFMFFPTVSHHAEEFDRGYTRSQNAHRLQELKAREEARREEQESAMGTGIHEISGPKRDESNKWKVSQGSLRVLNDGVGEEELQGMGITEGREGSTRSSYVFDHVTAELGPGASAAREELRHLVAQEGREAVRRSRSRSLERWNSEALAELQVDSNDGGDSAAASGFGSEEERKTESSR